MIGNHKKGPLLKFNFGRKFKFFESKYSKIRLFLENTIKVPISGQDSSRFHNFFNKKVQLGIYLFSLIEICCYHELPWAPEATEVTLKHTKAEEKKVHPFF